jgi:hypothetical protein
LGEILANFKFFWNIFRGTSDVTVIFDPLKFLGARSRIYNDFVVTLLKFLQI